MLDYEIDFIGNDTKGNSDAICFRWKDSNGRFHIGIYDCGTKSQANKMIKHIQKYYFKDMDKNERKIDCIVCSHADADHVRGVCTLLEAFSVDVLYANIPWKYAKCLKAMSTNYNSVERLISKLKKDYSDLAEAINYAVEHDIEIKDAFQGMPINADILIIAPTEYEYIKNIAESSKNHIKTAAESCGMQESYDSGLLENPETSEENETSVVLLGMINDTEKRFLLVGDSGVDNLQTALDYGKQKNYNIEGTVNFYQIPHHGGQHNLDDDTLNCMLGKNSKKKRVAFVSVGKGSDHPRKNVVEAYKKRGVKVYKTEGNIIHHQSGSMPDRDGWIPLEEL